METEKLIFLVFDRKPLWDQKSKSYHNRDKSRKLWEEVANELKVKCKYAMNVIIYLFLNQNIKQRGKLNIILLWYSP